MEPAERKIIIDCDNDLKQMDCNLLQELLSEMLLIRLFEEKVEKLTYSAKIPGGAHLSIGEEAGAVGVMRALEPLDYVVGTHRSHHVLLAKGLDINRLMSELMGKETGYCGGRGGHMHVADISKGMLGANGIVGASFGIANGAAFSIKYKKNKENVAVAFFGDGAANKGQFHENLNMASVLGLPVIFVCMNNQYAVETSFGYATACGTISERASSYNIPGICVDGMNVLEVYTAAKEARKLVLEEQCPVLLEAVLYRYKGHEIGEPGNYRTEDEIDLWRKRDPIIALKNAMFKEGLLTDEKWKSLEDECNKKIEAAVEYALNSPDPDPQTVLKNVFAEGLL